MNGHVIISHGLESSPDATKASALAKVAESLGWSQERPDYRDLDSIDRLGDVHARVARLRQISSQAKGPLVLAGSSMGAFISAQVSRQVPVLGLFLMALPTCLREGYDLALEAADVPTCIIHGWDDELIPAADVVRWAQPRRDRLVLVNDSHRLAAHVQFCASEFGRFLAAIA